MRVLASLSKDPKCPKAESHEEQRGQWREDDRQHVCVRSGRIVGRRRDPMKRPVRIRRVVMLKGHTSPDQHAETKGDNEQHRFDRNALDHGDLRVCREYRGYFTLLKISIEFLA